VEYTYDFGDGPFDLIVTVSGAASAQEMMLLRGELLGDPRLRPGMNVLYDLTGIDARGLTTDDLRELADDGRRFEPLGRHAVALVAPKPLAFGLGRMFEAFAANVHLADHVHVAESVDDAYAWLAGLR